MILIKILTSIITILLITEVAKRYCFWGGLIAVLPINIILSLIFLYIERRDVTLLSKFTLSAFQNIFLTMFFLGFLALFLNYYIKGHK